MFKQIENIAKKNFVKLLITISVGSGVFVLVITTNFTGVPDELGYMYWPAKFVGWNWDSISYNRAYFSPGAGILWIPFFWLFDDFILIHKAIVALNGVLIYVSFFLLYKTFKYIYVDMNNAAAYVIVSLVALYPPNLTYLQYACSETILYFCFILVFFFFTKYIKTVSKTSLIGLGISLIYIYLVHIRSIIIIFSAILGIALFEIKRKGKRLWAVGYLCLCVLVTYSLQDMFQSMYLECVLIDTENLGINTSFNIIGRIENMFSSFSGFINGLGGTIFYYIFGLNILLILFIVKIVKVMFVEKNFEAKLLYGFLLINFIIYFVALVSCKIYISRADIIFYARYMEHILGPIIVVGFYELYSNFSKKYFKYGGLLSIIMVIASYGIGNVIIEGEFSEFPHGSAVVIDALWNRSFVSADTYNYIYKIILFTFDFMIILCCLFASWKNKKKFFAGVVCFAIYWSLLASLAIVDNIKYINASAKYYKEFWELTECDDRDVLFYSKELTGKYFTKIQYLQLMCGEKPIQLVGGTDNIFNYLHEDKMYTILTTEDMSEMGLNKEKKYEGYYIYYVN